ncbi:FAD-dependent oxidoreductase [bacterium]|nr:FAD-dependent oxidoreductase [bacterium]
MNKENINKYKIIVIGAGISGSEAAIACANMGIKTLIINISMDNTALLKYSSKFGGNIRASLIREIGIMGGFIEKAIEYNKIAGKIEKEKNILSPAFIVDKKNFSLFYKYNLENKQNLETRQGLVCEIKENDYKEKYKIILNDGSIFYTEKIIIAAGTFLNGKILYGKNIVEAGRHGEISSNSLSKNLKDIGYDFNRIRTYISPRIDKKTIDLKKIKKIKTKEFKNIFKNFNNENKSKKENIFNYNTYITKDSLKTIIKNICGKENYKISEENVIYQEKYLIEYLKDNIFKNDIFEINLYKEGDNTIELYAEGFLSELPDNKQQMLINEFNGLENAVLTRAGYIIEYDALNTRQLTDTLRSKINENIYFTGEINGTWGYEESAAQGFIAGINASLDILGENNLIFDSKNTLLGFLSDNIILKNFNPPFNIDYEKDIDYKNFSYEESESRISKYCGILKKYKFL